MFFDALIAVFAIASLIIAIINFELDIVYLENIFPGETKEDMNLVNEWNKKATQERFDQPRTSQIRWLIVVLNVCGALCLFAR